jgi:hypothetical protein
MSFPSTPHTYSHFSTFVLCSAGRDCGDLAFELSALTLHISLEEAADQFERADGEQRDRQRTRLHGVRIMTFTRKKHEINKEDLFVAAFVRDTKGKLIFQAAVVKAH